VQALEAREQARKEAQEGTKELEEDTPMSDHQIKEGPSKEEEEQNMIEMPLFEKLKEQLYCPLCQDVFKNPQSVKQCLHKFC